MLETLRVLGHMGKDDAPIANVVCVEPIFCDALTLRSTCHHGAAPGTGAGAERARLDHHGFGSLFGKLKRAAQACVAGPDNCDVGFARYRLR